MRRIDLLQSLINYDFYRKLNYLVNRIFPSLSMFVNIISDGEGYCDTNNTRQLSRLQSWTYFKSIFSKTKFFFYVESLSARLYYEFRFIPYNVSITKGKISTEKMSEDYFQHENTSYRIVVSSELINVILGVTFLKGHEWQNP